MKMNERLLKKQTLKFLLQEINEVTQNLDTQGVTSGNLRQDSTVALKAMGAYGKALRVKATPKKMQRSIQRLGKLLQENQARIKQVLEESDDLIGFSRSLYDAIKSHEGPFSFEDACSWVDVARGIESLMWSGSAIQLNPKEARLLDSISLLALGIVQHSDKLAKASLYIQAIGKLQPEEEMTLFSSKEKVD